MRNLKYISIIGFVLLAYIFFKPEVENKPPASVDLGEQRKQWEAFKAERIEKHVKPKLSYLNAFQMGSNIIGEKLYLVSGPLPAETKWVSDKVKDPMAIATSSSDKVDVKFKDGRTFSFSSEDDKEKRQWPLPNKTIATLSLSKKSNRLWGYIYDPERIKKFTGFEYYPYNSTAIVEGTFSRRPATQKGYKTYQNIPRKVWVLGEINFKYAGKEFNLLAYNWQKKEDSKEYLAFIYTDRTAPKETYGGGREIVVDIDTLPESGSSLIVDFNQTSNFYCAHSPLWHCPVGLQQNLDIALMAGEKLPKEKMLR